MNIFQLRSALSKKTTEATPSTADTSTDKGTEVHAESTEADTAGRVDIPAAVIEAGTTKTAPYRTESGKKLVWGTWINIKGEKMPVDPKSVPNDDLIHGHRYYHMSHEKMTLFTPESIHPARKSVKETSRMLDPKEYDLAETMANNAEVMDPDHIIGGHIATITKAIVEGKGAYRRKVRKMVSDGDKDQLVGREVTAHGKGDYAASATLNDYEQGQVDSFVAMVANMALTESEDYVAHFMADMCRRVAELVDCGTVPSMRHEGHSYTTESVNTVKPATKTSKAKTSKKAVRRAPRKPASKSKAKKTVEYEVICEGYWWETGNCPSYGDVTGKEYALRLKLDGMAEGSQNMKACNRFMAVHGVDARDVNMVKITIVDWSGKYDSKVETDAKGRFFRGAFAGSVDSYSYLSASGTLKVSIRKPKYQD